MSGVAGNLYPAGKVYGVQVYVDPNLSFGDTRICIGRKGADEEPGVKFMPYIMAESLQTIAEGTFSPKIGMKSRYAITEAGWHPETQYVNMNVQGDMATLTGGVAVSQFDVDIGSQSQTFYAGGPQVGAQVETQLSKIDPNLSLRMEFVYTDYLTAEINGMDGVGDTGNANNSEITGSDSAGRVGIAYRF